MFRAGYGLTKNPLPWSRPMRGSYPFDINNNATATGTYDYVTTLATGIPAVILPDTSKGHGRPAERRLHPLAKPGHG